MENLSKNQLLAIEKIRKSQQTRIIRKASKPVRAITPKKPVSKKPKQFFPITQPYFYGTFRPAEARQKSQTLIEILKTEIRCTKKAAKKASSKIKIGAVDMSTYNKN